MATTTRMTILEAVRTRLLTIQTGSGFFNSLSAHQVKIIYSSPDRLDPELRPYIAIGALLQATNDQQPTSKKITDIGVPLWLYPKLGFGIESTDSHKQQAENFELLNDVYQAINADTSLGFNVIWTYIDSDTVSLSPEVLERIGAIEAIAKISYESSRSVA